MGSGRCIIHVRLTGSAPSETILKNLLRLRYRIQFYLSHTINNDHSCGRFFNFELDGSLILRQEQITQLIEVELNHVAFELNVKVTHSLEDLEHFDDRTRRKTRHVRASLDRECFSRARLAVRKNNNIVAVNRRLDQPLGIFEHLVLRAFRPKNRIEVVIFHPVLLVAHRQGDLIVLLVARHEFLGICFLGIRKGPNPTVHTNFAFCVLKLVEQALALDLLLLVLGGDDVQLARCFFQVLLERGCFLLQGGGLTCCLFELVHFELERS